jgi:hypothetical protein
MSAAKVLAQGNPSLLVSFPGWKAPTFMQLRATIGASGAPTIASTASANGDPPSSLDMTIARVSAAVYDVTFAPCRQVAWSTLNVTCKTTSAGSFAAADPRSLAIDKSSTNTNSTTGKLRFCLAQGTTLNTELGNGQELELSFWADLG